MVVSFDLFGTLVDVDRSGDPADAVATALTDHGVTVPDDWADAYREQQLPAPDGAEVRLPTHVEAALESRGIDASTTTVRAAVVEAFTAPVRTRPGAVETVAAAADLGPVAVLSNCSVPGLVADTLARSEIDPDAFDAVVTSAACGWRKPDPRAFEGVTDRLGCSLADLVHVGDDPRADGGIEQYGGTAVLLSDVPLADVPERLAELERQRGDEPCR